MDSQYVSRTLGRCLSEGLAELMELRPLDPIEFLSLWIRQYKHNQQLELEKASHQRQLEEEQRRLQDETLHQKILQEEQNRIRAAHEPIQRVPESADESKPADLNQREDERETAADPADHTESETVNELNDQVINHMMIPSIREVYKAKAAAHLLCVFPHQEEETNEDQTSEILNPQEPLPQEDHSDTQNESNEADAPSEENQPGAEKTEDSDQRQIKLDDSGVALYAVVKENIGIEIQDFRPYFNGEIFQDEKRGFYGPQERWMGVSGILRSGVWTNGWRAYQNGYWGNVRGEGFILGAVYVIGPRQQEASELSSLKPQLDDSGVALYAVVKENIGTEIQDFRSYFNGEIFQDEKMCFYGPKRRTMRGLGIARFGVWRNILQVWRKGYHGNTKGEGFVLGGLYVIGPENQGILLEHHEKEFGDKADLSAVRKAVSRIQKTEETREN
ncbi:Redox-regulatory protein FAM213A [Anabarilius grahami]|uniref:Peroxiredoxin-like 2A n=1 Tax=Anabarilius grahami TaxID=495550 RepID=A0A3N0XP66_ANAGA|nr:Redox-regulatory protein FAM213A [Anabarilius grahami]